MKFWRIKWELILTMLTGTTVVSGILLYDYVKDMRVFAMTIVATIMLAMFILSYKHIKTIRHEVIRGWK